MSTLDLLVLGDLNPDVIVSGVAQQVRFGQAEQLVDRGALVMGGSAGITACGAARLGLTVGVCSVVGDDELGRFTTAQVAAAGVDVGRVRTDQDVATGLSVILDRGGDRAILTAPGSITSLSAGDLALLPTQPARHVHVSSYFLMSRGYRDALPDSLRRWRAAGVTTSLDCNWDPERTWDLGEMLDCVDVFLPNAAELAAVTGADDLDAGLAAATSGGATVVVKLGATGARASVDGHRLHVSALPPRAFGDAVGAGDSFDAGLLAGRLTGRLAADSLRLAVAAGTLSTRGVGGTAAQPDLAEAVAWGAELQVWEEQ